jgi:transposase
MRAISTFPRILLHRGIVDFRKGRRGLAALVESEIKESPFTTTLFLFMSRRRDCIRALYWDRTGFALWEKGLEEARFAWPRGEARVGQIVLSATQVEWLLEGVDIWRLRPHRELEYSRVC